MGIWLIEMQIQIVTVFTGTIAKILWESINVYYALKDIQNVRMKILLQVVVEDKIERICLMTVFVWIIITKIFLVKIVYLVYILVQPVRILLLIVFYVMEIWKIEILPQSVNAMLGFIKIKIVKLVPNVLLNFIHVMHQILEFVSII